MSKVEVYLTEGKGSSSPEIAEIYNQLEEYYNKKLWHQLTVLMMKLVLKQEMKEGIQLINLYNNLIADVENKINPLSLAEMVSHVCEQYTDPDEAISFLEKTIPKVQTNLEAKVLCNVLIAGICLNKLEDKLRTKKVLEETETILDEIQGVAPVHARFYLLQSNLHRSSGSHAEYYRSALRYLGCLELNSLDQDTQREHAFFLGLAALLGKGVYNFGELLAHPVLKSLKGTSREWVTELLNAFNAGKIQKFESMRSEWSTQADLLAQEEPLREKIRLLCLMEMTFKRAARDRSLSFSEIAEATGLQEEQVEVMVMKALSLGLVKGTIDQVDQKVSITWVQPRVLDTTQLEGMMDRLNDWCRDVTSMETLLEKQAGPILTL